MRRCRILTHPEHAAWALARGRLVAVPTETVYGLAADVRRPEAIARIFEVKQRPTFDPLIVHVLNHDWLMEVAQDVPPVMQRLIERFWPGPLTLVLPKRQQIADLVTAGLPTVAVRAPRHPTTRAVLRALRHPIAAPSANLFGRLSPTRVRHVLHQLHDRIDYLLLGKPCQVGVESTVIAMCEGQVVILRAGGVTAEALADELGYIPSISTSSAKPEAPGQLPYHYAPRTPLRVVDQLPAHPPPGKWGALVLSPLQHSGYQVVIHLSKTGDLREAAAQFFESLFRLDLMGLDGILAVRFPAEGLGVALNDRLQRAAQSHPA